MVQARASKRASAARPVKTVSSGESKAEQLQRVETQRMAYAMVVGDRARAAAEAVAADEDFETNPITKARFFTQGRRTARRVELRRQLIKASRDMVEVYIALLDDRQIWEHLSRQKFEDSDLGLTRKMLVVEAATQPIAPMLKELGYGDVPPPAEEWAELIQQTLRILSYGVGPQQGARLAADAQCHLWDLVERLELLVEDAEREADHGPVDESDRGVKSRLRRMLKASCSVAAPVMLIAFSSTSIAAAVTGDAGMAAAIAGSQEAISSVLTLGAAGYIAQRRAPSLQTPRLDLESGVRTLERCINLVGDPPREDYATLLVGRAAMQLVADAGRLTAEHTHDEWLNWATKVGTLLANTDFKQSSALKLCQKAKSIVELVN